MNLGERIVAKRQQLGWTQNQLAREAGLNQPTLQKIEAGTRNPSFAIAIAIAKALKISVNELAGLDGSGARTVTRPGIEADPEQPTDAALGVLIAQQLKDEIAELRARLERLEAAGGAKPVRPTRAAQ